MKLQAARTAGLPFFASIGGDPRVKASGHFADGRGGFFLLELNSAEEMIQFTGPFLDFVRFESHPVLSLPAIAQDVHALGARPAWEHALQARAHHRRGRLRPREGGRPASAPGASRGRVKHYSGRGSTERSAR